MSPESGATASRTAGLCRSGWCQASTRLLFRDCKDQGQNTTGVPGDCTRYLPTDREWVVERGPGQLRSQLRGFLRILSSIYDGHKLPFFFSGLFQAWQTHEYLIREIIFLAFEVGGGPGGRCPLGDRKRLFSAEKGRLGTEPAAKYRWLFWLVRAMGRGFSSLDAGLTGLGQGSSQHPGPCKDWILEGSACGWWGGLDAPPECHYKKTTPPHRSLLCS